MCIVCAEFNNGKLTVLEAFQNLSEMETSIPREHYQDVLEMLNDELNEQSSFGMEPSYSMDDGIDTGTIEDDYELPWSGYSEYDNFDD